MSFPGSIFAPPGIYDAEVDCRVCGHTHYSMAACPRWAHCYPRSPEDFLRLMTGAGHDPSTVVGWVEDMKVRLAVRKERGDYSGIFWFDDMRLLVRTTSGRRILQDEDGRWVKDEDGRTVLRDEITFGRCQMRPDVAHLTAGVEGWGISDYPTK